jgi:putative hydrolase of the HAD superfamily
MPESKPETLLFDLGGVLIDIDFSRALRAWQPFSRLSFDELKQAFRFDEHYARHERGEIAAGQYFEHLTAVLALDAEPAEIERGWNAIFVSEIAETLELVRAARGRMPCHVFTNTNATHQAAWSRMFPTVATSFDRIFASHEIGLRKPERRAFEHVARALGVPASSIMFFDDSLENVEGARKAGLQAVHVRKPQDVANALQTDGQA